MQDLSDLAKNSMWPTSQAGGNMLASSEEAMTAPGSAPVDNLDDHLSEVHENPAVENSNASPIPPATDGKPQASRQQGFTPGRPAWGGTTVPEVVRDDSGAAPKRKPAPGGTVPQAMRQGNR